jgi:hypothetical protein
VGRSKNTHIEQYTQSTLHCKVMRIRSGATPINGDWRRGRAPYNGPVDLGARIPQPESAISVTAMPQGLTPRPI